MPILFFRIESMAYGLISHQNINRIAATAFLSDESGLHRKLGAETSVFRQGRKRRSPFSIRLKKSFSFQEASVFWHG